MFGWVDLGCSNKSELVQHSLDPSSSLPMIGCLNLAPDVQQLSPGLSKPHSLAPKLTGTASARMAVTEAFHSHR